MGLVLLTIVLPLLFAPGIAAGLWLTRTAGRGIVWIPLFLSILLSPLVVFVFVDYLCGPKVFPEVIFGDFNVGDFLLSPVGVLSVFLMVNLPLSVQCFLWAYQSIHQALIDAAFCTGVSRFDTFVRVVLPLSRPAAMAVSLGVFAISLGEWVILFSLSASSVSVKNAIYKIFQIKNTPTDFQSFLASIQANDYQSFESSVQGLFVLFAVGLGLYYSFQKHKVGP